MSTINRPTNNNSTSNVNEQQPSSQQESTTGVFHGVPVSSSLGGYKPTPPQVRAAGFSPLTRNPQVEATSTEPSAPPLASHLTASHLPPQASRDIKTSDKLRNLATTYRDSGNKDKATILDLQADFLEGQDQQLTLQQSFDFPEGYPNHSIETFRDRCSLNQEYEKGAQFCQKLFDYYKKNPSQKAAIMKHATNLQDYCKCLNNVSQEFTSYNLHFETSAHAQQLLATRKQVDQDLWGFENLPSCSIS